MSVQEQYSLSHSISVDKETCKYTGMIKFNAPNANVPFPSCPSPPILPGSKAPPSYKFGSEFYKATGFDHLGLDWSQCGHGNAANFGKAHFDFHLYRITSAQRDLKTCDLIPAGTVCARPGGTVPDQTTVAVKKFFAVGTVTGDTAHPDYGRFANMPAIFTDQVGAATPYSGIHVYDIAGAVPVADWTNPVLMIGIGSYDSQIAFLETMFPYTFVNGTTS